MKAMTINGISLLRISVNTIHALLVCLLVTSLISCEDSIYNEARILQSNPVTIPAQKLVKRICSAFPQSSGQQGCLRLVYFIDSLNCQTCHMNQLIKAEKMKTANPNITNIEFIYIIQTNSERSEFLYAQLCNARIEGTVYLDTCNAFRHANPHIPDNPLFHTFVLNEQDSVVLVGDPFKNEKMESLLLKVIEIEKEKKARKNSGQQVESEVEKI